MATSKRRGIKSSAQDNFLEPSAVTSLSATAVNGGNNGNGTANLTWSLPAASPPATLYTVTSNPATTTQTSTSTSITFSGLTGGTSYTFTVVASNAAGNSLPTSTTTGVTPTTLPNAPSAPTASSPNANQDVVSWSAPSSNGGTAITGYTLKSSDGPTYDYDANTTSATISETAGTSQTYQVLAKNANGNGPYSVSSNTITTTAPFFPFFPPYFPYFPPYFPYFPPYFPFFPFFPPFFPPYFPFFPPFFPPYFPFFPPFFPPYFPFFPPFFPPYFPAPSFPYFPYFKVTKCIAGESEVLTTEGYKPAKSLSVGDKLLTIDPKDFNDGQITSELSLSDKIVLSETEIVKVELSQKPMLSFNDSVVKFSNAQPIFVKDGESLKYKTTGEITVGDILAEIDPETCQITYTTVETITEHEAGDVYDIRCLPNQWFIVGNYIVIS